MLSSAAPNASSTKSESIAVGDPARTVSQSSPGVTGLSIAFASSSNSPSSCTAIAFGTALIPTAIAHNASALVPFDLHNHPNCIVRSSRPPRQTGGETTRVFDRSRGIEAAPRRDPTLVRGPERPPYTRAESVLDVRPVPAEPVAAAPSLVRSAGTGIDKLLFECEPDGIDASLHAELRVCVA